MQDDIVKYALDAKLINTPGKVFKYNNKALNLLPKIIENTVKTNLKNYLSNHFFKDLDIKDFDWSQDNNGNYYGMSGLQIFPEDLIKFGHLIMNNGKYNGKQLIDSTLFKEQILTPPNNFFLKTVKWIPYYCFWLMYDDENNIIGINSNGDKGQWLVCYFLNKIVSVRMREKQDFNKELWTHIDFIDDVKNI